VSAAVFAAAQGIAPPVSGEDAGTAPAAFEPIGRIGPGSASFGTARAVCSFATFDSPSIPRTSPAIDAGSSGAAVLT
jgi:hypothetical protein